MNEENLTTGQTFARSTRLERNKQDKGKRRQAAKPKVRTRRDWNLKLFNYLNEV